MKANVLGLRRAARPTTDRMYRRAANQFRLYLIFPSSGSISLLRLDNECTGSECTVTNMQAADAVAICCYFLMYLPNPMSRSQVDNKHGVEDVSGYARQVAREAGDEQICDCATEAPVPLLVLHQQLRTHTQRLSTRSKMLTSQDV